MEREIGFIKWFGGRNKQGELQNYGFIQDLSLKDVYVNRRRFLKGVEEESIEPDKIVFYNIKELKDGRIEAINVETIDQVDDLSLLRELRGKMGTDSIFVTKSKNRDRLHFLKSERAVPACCAQVPRSRARSFVLRWFRINGIRPRSRSRMRVLRDYMG
ncbi:hypothetical protein V512_004390 [Mesotoga sp. Brook.08.105.5.1]|uniref:hypothetical protein n=1 Tax=Mesotoga sp. Brook.08.105.5.1 TaxID=1421002 RepID=UPI000C179968|nr:hypothetical protein [Mesotoga sp. Brook.08.105.5.1]PVD16172.1 hypothetical protein V512_004390 [Mesotoga sp. Brook.08.105.5.1]